MDIIKGCLDDISQAGSRSEKEMVSSRSLELISSDVIGKKDEESSQEIIGCLEEKLPFDQVAVSEDYMDITKGSLEEISRPASSERCLSGSQGSLRPGSLEVLSPDLSDNNKVEGHTQERIDCPAENSSDQDDSDEENEDPELRKAMKIMKKLDQILALKVSAEREVKRKGRELHQRLWQELQDVSLTNTPESRDEEDNTRRFLALTPNNFQDCSEGDFVPVFGTEVLDLNYDLNPRHQSEEHTHVESAGCSEVGQQVMEDQPSDRRQRGAAHGKCRQDFVRKNIELAGAAGNSVLLTQQERERIEELLKDLEEGQNDAPEVVSECLGSLSAVEGFSPEPSELNNLLHIDSKLQLLLPVEDFLSVWSPCPDISPSQVRPQSLNESLAEKSGVLWDVRERRDQERRMREIQQQLQELDETQRSASDCLSDDQLRNLLLKCEHEIIRSSSETSLRMISALDAHSVSLLVSSPRLSSSDLSQLLQDAHGSPTPPQSQENTHHTEQ
ncbi:fibrous sheath-interacting protein 1 isoform X2 [Xyrauchen texanus]|nr:fibrous sheath-interacting protein 1 isoform X2 [Xyrauchen texanus]